MSVDSRVWCNLLCSYGTTGEKTTWDLGFDRAPGRRFWVGYNGEAIAEIPIPEGGNYLPVLAAALDHHYPHFRTEWQHLDQLETLAFVAGRIVGRYDERNGR